GALAFLAALAQACAQADVPITLCGEMGGRPLEAMALVGLGYRSLSMPPAAVGPVKAMVRSVEIDALERYLRGQIRSSRRSIRENLLSFARDHGIAV
ncbi:MAG TPA: putative PEP-binding protein, partial [Alphaproteobacteria bacterium]|nr:putative PEP-binding protein [Alphaproteobacteria bacterium]